MLRLSELPEGVSDSDLDALLERALKTFAGRMRRAADGADQVVKLLRRRDDIRRARLVTPGYQMESTREHIEAIMDRVARHYRLSVADLVGGSLARHHTEARHLAMFLLRGHTALSYPAIAELFTSPTGDYSRTYHHSTVIAGVAKVRKQMEASPSFMILAVRLGNDIRAACVPSESVE